MVSVSQFFLCALCTSRSVKVLSSFYNEEPNLSHKRTMEYKNLLQNWKTYQKWQLKKRLLGLNMFTCNLYSTLYNYNQAILSFINNGDGERRLEFCSSDALATSRTTIAIANIQGYSPDGRKIILTLRQGPLITLEFPTDDIQALAFAELQDLASERVHLIPTPSSSESSPSLEEQ